MKSKKLFIISAALLLISSCNGGLPGSSSSSSNNVNESTSSAISSNVNEGTSISSATSQTQQAKTYTIGIGSSTTVSSRFVCSNGISYASSNDKIYTDVTDAVRFGSSKGTGQIVFNLSSASVIKTIIVDSGRYNNDSSAQLKITLSNGESQTLAIGDRQEYYFSFSSNSSSNKITFENLAKSQRVNLYGITISSSVITSSNNSSSVSSQVSSNVSSNTSSSNTSQNTTSSNTGASGNVNYNGTYYNSITATSGTTLKSQLRTLISSTHKKVTTYSELKTYLQKADQDPNNPNKMLLYYTGESINKTDNMNVWNREHVWPQSLGWFTTSGAGADMHHIRPCDVSVNSQRGNTKFGESSGYYNASKKGADYRGDTARIILYLFTRYSESDSKSFTSIFESKEILLKWHREDPVSETEIIRNDYTEIIQKNRNPFIDHPEYVAAIWG